MWETAIGEDAVMAASFPSKRDLWISIVVWTSVLVMAICIAPLWVKPADWVTRVWVTVLLIASILLSLGVLYGTKYTLHEDHLLVQSGPVRWRVPYEMITKVSPSRSLLSGPACSLDRLLISRSDRLIGLVISPVDKEQFLKSLAEQSDRFVFEEGQIRTEN